MSPWAIVRCYLRDPTFSRFSRTPTCDGRTDGHRQTDTGDTKCRRQTESEEVTALEERVGSRVKRRGRRHAAGRRRRCSLEARWRPGRCRGLGIGVGSGNAVRAEDLHAGVLVTPQRAPPARTSSLWPRVVAEKVGGVPEARPTAPPLLLLPRLPAPRPEETLMRVRVKEVIYSMLERPAILPLQLWQGCQVSVKISAQRLSRVAQIYAC